MAPFLVAFVAVVQLTWLAALAYGTYLVV